MRISIKRSLFEARHAPQALGTLDRRGIRGLAGLYERPRSLLGSHRLRQFRDTHFQPLDLPTDTVFVEHLPVDHLPEEDDLYAADEDGGIHQWELR